MATPAGATPRLPVLSCNQPPAAGVARLALFALNRGESAQQLEGMPTNLREVLAVGLFVVMASYVGFSGIRLGLLLWERFA